jgi:hypothetical protein
MSVSQLRCAPVCTALTSVGQAPSPRPNADDEPVVPGDPAHRASSMGRRLLDGSGHDESESDEKRTCEERRSHPLILEDCPLQVHRRERIEGPKPSNQERNANHGKEQGHQNVARDRLQGKPSVRNSGDGVPPLATGAPVYPLTVGPPGFDYLPTGLGPEQQERGWTDPNDPAGCLRPASRSRALHPPSRPGCGAFLNPVGSAAR